MSRRARPPLALLWTALLLLAALPHATAVRASTITVTSSADDGTGVCPGANCQLRTAIAAAVPGDTIDFQSGLSSPITLTLGQLVIDKNLTITGPAANLLAVDGNNTSRIFNIDSTNTSNAQVAITGITMQHAGNSGGSGGAMLIGNSGSVTLDRVTFANNSAGYGAASGPGVRWSSPTQASLAIRRSVAVGCTCRTVTGRQPSSTSRSPTTRQRFWVEGRW
jgi:hypothetical protein